MYVVLELEMECFQVMECELHYMLKMNVDHYVQATSQQDKFKFIVFCK